jgi:hypothetical protein
LRAVVGITLALDAIAGGTATRAPSALLGDRLLFLAHALIENGEGFIEAAVDLGAAVFGRGRAAAGAPGSAPAGPL